MNQQYNFTVFIGRFQPFHRAHLNIIKQALDLSEDVIVLIGSSFQPRTVKNPWSFSERVEMISSCFSAEDRSRIHFKPLQDRLYNDAKWIEDVQNTVKCVQKDLNKENSKVALIGYHKDEGSWFLDAFPQWPQIEVDEHKLLNATDIREIYLHPENYLKQADHDKMPEPVIEYIEAFEQTSSFDYLVNEYKFLLKHVEMWKDAPYPPTFNCADAIVIQSGHVLMITRKAAPGKNLLALPGGYINQNEDTLSAAIRELKEETKLKVPEKVLRGSIFESKLFDHPKRSLRGRIFSHTFGFHLMQGGKLPKVKGSDDAAHAQWFTFDQISDLRHQIFEDHADIIYHYLNKL